MKKSMKLLALVLCAAMIVPLFAACGNSSKEPDGPQGGQTTYEGTPTSVPDDLLFDGEKFTILCRADSTNDKYLYEIEADENETEVVNQAVYQRNLIVEERFGVELVAHDVPGGWNDSTEFKNTFRNSTLAGSGAFDLIMGYQAYMCELGLTDLYVNFYDIPYIKEDINNIYFFQDNVKELTVDGQIYFLVGDYCLTYFESLYVMYFNKLIANNENVGDIYQIVRDGEWTIDKCIELSKGVYNDLDGNGYKNDNDRFGLITDYENTADAIFSFFDVQSTGHDDNGKIILDLDQGKMVSILEKMIAFYKTDDVFAHKTSSSDVDIPFDAIFTEDRALFYPERLCYAQTYRGMETDFGIIPYPKWDTNQDKYYTQAQNAYSVAVVPLDAPNLEKTGAIFDVLSALSYDLVTPAYYDMALKGKFARDNESGEMLDIIRDGICINFGFFYNANVGPAGAIRLLLHQENSNFVSYYAANKKGYERNLKKVLKVYEDRAAENNEE